MARLFVVAGHGAGDPGAVGNGYQEQERVRALAARLKSLGGDSVVVGDTSIDWYGSNKFASASIPNDAVVVELHMDSASASARGGHVIIKQGFTPDNFDNALAAFIGSYFPGRSNKLVGRSDLQNVNVCASRGINYRLLEVCFISNKDDVIKFNGDIDAVAMGILGAAGIVPTSTRPALPLQVLGEALNNIGLGYKAHVAATGWLAAAHDGQQAGTIGFGARLEALQVAPSDGLRLGCCAHVSGVGWVDYGECKDGVVCGTTGQSKAIEAIGFYEIENTTGKQVRFAVHQADYGWGSMQLVGKIMLPLGSTGQGRQLEAIKIWME